MKNISPSINNESLLVYIPSSYEIMKFGILDTFDNYVPVIQKYYNTNKSKLNELTARGKKAFTSKIPVINMYLAGKKAFQDCINDIKVTESYKKKIVTDMINLILRLEDSQVIPMKDSSTDTEIFGILIKINNVKLEDIKSFIDIVSNEFLIFPILSSMIQCNKGAVPICKIVSE